jgi:hypothetical protein
MRPTQQDLPQGEHRQRRQNEVLPRARAVAPVRCHVATLVLGYLSVNTASSEQIENI